MVTKRQLKKLAEEGLIGGGNANFSDYFHEYIKADGTKRFEFLGGNVYKTEIDNHIMLSCDVYLKANDDLTTEQSVFSLNSNYQEYGSTSLSFISDNTDYSCTLSNSGNFNRKDNNIARSKGFIYHYIFRVEIQEKILL